MRLSNPCLLVVNLALALLCCVSCAATQKTSDESVTDVDGNVYATVKIGDQVWLAENLRTTHYSDGTPVASFVMDNDEANAAKYGRLYRTGAALRDSSLAEGDSREIQGVSPDGWHIPSAEEWLELVNHLGGEAVAGGRLKEAGFGALPSGWFDFTGEFKGFGEKTFLRSATSPGGHGSFAWEVNLAGTACTRAFLHPDDAIPIRCLKNK